MEGVTQKSGVVCAVSRSASHTLQKQAETEIVLLKGLGIEGDAHAGITVKHRSRVAKDSTKPNLRQVHLIHEELHHELAQKGFDVGPGQMGENITTSGLDLLSLPQGTLLHLGETAVIEVTGLRNPCAQLDSIQEGLMKAVLGRDEAGNLIRKSGVFGIVLNGGVVKIGDKIIAVFPSGEKLALEPV